jgi:spore coat protein CotF
MNMKLAAHEAYELQELILSCVNTVTCMGIFLNQVKDSNLKSIVQNQFAAHIKDYNIKVSFLNDSSDISKRLEIPELKDDLSSYTNLDRSVEPTEPRIDAKKFDDREIATCYLLTLKRAGREYAWSAMDTSHPEIRCFLEDAFKMVSDHAFEIWKWMVKEGYYPLDEAPQYTLDTFAKLYQKVDISSIKEE